jgi:chaperonin cofactor prefoldin
MSDGGKGSSPRPYSVSNEEYANRWDAIFNREKIEKALDNLAKVSEELGLRDDDVNPMIKK